MKKNILVFCFALCASFAFSQQPLYKGASQINFGIASSTTGIPLYFGLDHSITRNISLGAELAYRLYNENWQNNVYNHNVFGLLGNLNYHFNSLLGITSHWDIYAGGNVGFYVWISPSGYTGKRSSQLGFGAQLGARYYFTDLWAINFEVTGSNAFSGGKLGMTYRF